MNLIETNSLNHRGALMSTVLTLILVFSSGLLHSKVLKAAPQEAKVFDLGLDDSDAEEADFSSANEATDSPSYQDENITTAEKLENLKQEVLAVNRDLFILEEDLLFPASTQVATYFSVDIGYFFSLDNIKITIDDKTVTHFLYTEKDIDALYRGAIQKLYLGNVSRGEHELVAVIIGRGPHNREYRNAVSFKFNKDTEAKALEIQLRDDQGKMQPKLKVIEW
ncbi:MAG: hypothetical protein Q9M92_13865 [Enterobacterales bacterium]|nr:hypothetical protein [Enterobacterales bacterium]